MNKFSLNDLGNKAKNTLHVKKSPFGKNAKEGRHAVWVKDSNFKKIKLLTIDYEKTSIMDWVNKAIEHSFKDGTLPKPKI